MASMEPLIDRKKYLGSLQAELQTVHPAVRVAAFTGEELEQLPPLSKSHHIHETEAKRLREALAKLTFDERLQLLNACLPELQGQEEALETRMLPKPSRFRRFLRGIGSGAKFLGKLIINGLTTKNFWLGLTYSTTLVATNNYFLSASYALTTIALTGASILLISIPMYRKALKAYNKVESKELGHGKPEKMKKYGHFYLITVFRSYL